MNEWLADGAALHPDDFVELYNPANLPVAMGGLTLTDNITSAIDRHRIASAGGWELTLSTPGGGNRAVTLGDPRQLRLNEWMANPTDGADWIELHNAQGQPVALGGLHLTDDLVDRRRHSIAPLSFVGVGAGATVVFVADGDGRLIDGLTFGLQVQGVSSCYITWSLRTRTCSSSPLTSRRWTSRTVYSPASRGMSFSTS